MTRSYSLKMLADWADWSREGRSPGYIRSLNSADEARRHGVNAVRAIQDLSNPINWHIANRCYMKDEAKKAFRAALNAVGLKSL